MKNLVFKIILIFFSIAIALIAGEVIARKIYVKPWYAKLIRDGQAGHDLKVKIKQNKKARLSLRAQDYSTEKQLNCKRVLILGDSFTYGLGIADASTVFPKILENRLNEEFLPNGKKIEIFNAGMPGSLTNDWVKLLLERKDSFKPDVILVVFFLRDGTKLLVRNFFHSIRKEIKLREKLFLYRHSYFFRLILDCFDRLYLSKKYSKALQDAYFGNPEQTQEWENAKINILKIKDAGEEIHAKVGLIVFPILVELNSKYPFKNIVECIVNFGIKNHILTHSLLPAFMGQDAPGLWVSSADQHPNKQAHLLAAESMLPFLRELLISSDK